jgi:hypothetical protein
MKHVDMRKLPAAAQEERRRQVVGLRESGLTYEAIAAQVRLTRTGVFNICRRFARSEKGTIFWGDETGVRSDDGRGRSFAPRGRTPVVRPSHKRAGLGLISAVTNKGELRWMVLDGALKAPGLIRFLARLIQDANGKVFLIWDILPAHRARAVRDWLAERTEQIEVFSLPSYSPELNLDEGLNADLKHAVIRKPPARSKHELKRTVISYMRRLTKLPEQIRSYFGHRPFRYAAYFKISQAGSIIRYDPNRTSAYLPFYHYPDAWYDQHADCARSAVSFGL